MSDLLAATADLMAMPSVSGEEGEIAGAVHGALSACDWLEVERVGDNVVARTHGGREHRLVLAGHLDTVPPGANASPKLDGDTLWGVGASDMKGGLAVMLDLAVRVPAPAVDVTWCFYAREEVSRDQSGLVELLEQRPDLLTGDAAILGEPTSALVEAGCQGTMRVRLTLRGVRAHTARPFTGRNAVHRLAPVLDRIASWPPREVVLDGCTYAEQLQVVGVEGGVASNVVPDEARLIVNHRYAPGPGPRRGRSVPPRAARPAPRARRGRHVGAPRRRRRGAALARPPAAEGVGRQERRRTEGQGGLDRRRVLLGPRGPGGELRTG